jgi:REP element-mobilizing transposase RayT
MPVLIVAFEAMCDKIHYIIDEDMYISNYRSFQGEYSCVQCQQKEQISNLLISVRQNRPENLVRPWIQ